MNNIILQKIIIFIKMNIGEFDHYNTYTYNYSKGYNKALRDIQDIIDNEEK